MRIKRLLISLSLSFVMSFSYASETDIYSTLDERYVTSSTNGEFGPWTGNIRSGVNVQNSIWVYHRGAGAYNSQPTPDYAFVLDCKIEFSNCTSPDQAHHLKVVEMSNDPRNMSASSLNDAVESGSGYADYYVTTSGLSGWKNLASAAPDIENSLGSNLFFLGFRTGEAWTENNSWMSYNTRIRVEREIRMSTSGELSRDERWGGDHTLSGNVTVPSGVKLTLWSGLDLSLNGYYVKSTGGAIEEQNNVDASPDVRITEGSSIKGYYASISQAISNASSGQTIAVNSSQTISSDLTVPSGVTLSLEGGTITMNANITTTSGTIVLDGATLSTDIRLKSGSSIKGLYSNVQDAVDDCGSTETVFLASGTYSEDIDMISNAYIVGAGMTATIIDGDVDFGNKSYAEIQDMTVNGDITMDGGSYNYLTNVKAKDLVDIDLGVNNELDDVTTTNSGYLEIYQSDVVVDGLNSQNSVYNAAYVYEADPELYNGYYKNKDKAVYCAARADALLEDIQFCGNNCDIYAGTGSDVDASEVSLFSNITNVTCGSGNVTLPSLIIKCTSLLKASPEDLNIPGASITVDTDSNRERFRRLKSDYREIRKKLRLDRDKGRADALRYAADYLEIIGKAKKLVDDASDEEIAVKAVRLVSNCYRALNEQEQVNDYAISLLKRNEAMLTIGALSVQIPYFITKEQFDKALAAADQLISLENDDENRQALLYRKGVIYQKYLRDADKAAALYSQVIAADAESGPALSAQRRLDKMGKDFDPGAPQGMVEEKLEFAAANYPNPANPGTTIRYTLPEDGFVSIRIYNINGRLVAELVDAAMTAGRHAVRWDGRTAAGQAAATGVYFYRLQFEDRVMSRKFLLLR